MVIDAPTAVLDTVRYRTDRALRRWALLGSLLRKLSWYTAGSIVATVVSELVFLGVYELGSGPVLSSVAAFIPGAILNYVLNRRWAWHQPTAARTRRQMLLYGVIVISTAFVAVGTTSVTDAWSRIEVSSHTVQALLGGAAYLLTYGVMFFVKFVLFDRLVFVSSDLPAASGGSGPESAS